MSSEAVEIHPTAVVGEHVELGRGVVVGPHAVIGDDVAIGDGSRLWPSSMVLSHTRMGARNVVFPFAVLGAEPQHRTYAGEPTLLVIGDDNVFREHVTAHRGTAKDNGVTRIGSGSLFMVGTHVAHDCTVGTGVTLANGTLLGGHVTVGDQVVTGGAAAVAQFVRIGRAAFLAAGARVEHDVPPFVIAAGDRARVRALNRIGLERSGVAESSRQALVRAFRILYRSGAPRARGIEVCQAELGADACVAELLAFLRQT